MKTAKRLAYYDVAAARAQSAKTFDGKVYKLQGAVAVEQDTGNIKRVADIYYDIRSVRDHNQRIMAKRRHKQEELKEVSSKSS
ncbi:hypothetical protein [Priestia endophytica]|uniref:hypothetical protein n=1 Tax=Priestia endophytica TaxID=135735 RepID=UPI00124E6BB7|nr:hypothetical protein [Priestia endophytica]KAB2488191.1 hypothetical protein F8155_25245 [Priestia endophytica]